MCGGRSSILHYGPLIETNYLYAPTPNGQSPSASLNKSNTPPPLRVKKSNTHNINTGRTYNLHLVDLKQKTETVLPNCFKFNVDFSFTFYFDM